MFPFFKTDVPFFGRRRRINSQGTVESKAPTAETQQNDLERYLIHQNAHSTQSTTSDASREIGHRDPFAHEENADIQYKTMKWW